MGSTIWRGIVLVALAAAPLGVFAKGSEPEEGTASMTASEMLEQARTVAKRIGHMLEEAREHNDVLRANCLNRKLSEANARLDMMEDRARQRAEAEAKHADADVMAQHDLVMSVLAQSMQTVDQDAQDCLGEESFAVGASQVVVTTPNNGPQIDPGVLSPAPSAPPSITIPPPLSGTR